MTSDERFERIERTLERITEKVDRIAVGNIELGEKVGRIATGNIELGKKVGRIAVGNIELGEKVDRIAEGHIELEGAQLIQQRLHEESRLNMERAHTQVEESLKSFIDETRERIGNLTILVDRFIARDLGAWASPRSAASVVRPFTLPSLPPLPS